MISFQPDPYTAFKSDRERRLALKDRHRRDVILASIVAVTCVLTQAPWQAVWQVVRFWIGRG
jgi:hypothetical protein